MGLANALWHVFAGVFIIWILLGYLKERRKNAGWKASFVPAFFLTEKNCQPGRLRSRLVRSLDFIRAELEEAFECHIELLPPQRGEALPSGGLRDLLAPLCVLTYAGRNKMESDEYFFLFNGESLSPHEVYTTLNKKGAPQITFLWNTENRVWEVKLAKPKL